MSVLKAIKNRYSCRNFQDRKVEEDKLEDILKAAQLAPSANNLQPYKLVVAKDEKVRKILGQNCKQDFISKAPIIIAGVSLEPREMMSSGASKAAVDVAIALEHIALQAADLDLASCWVGAFEQEEAKQALSISADKQIIALMPIGYPADKPGERERKDLDELTSVDKFSR
jgi:nitroreductase